MALLILLLLVTGLTGQWLLRLGARGLSATPPNPDRRRVPLVTDAVAYIGTSCCWPDSVPPLASGGPTSPPGTTWPPSPVAPWCS